MSDNVNVNDYSEKTVKEKRKFPKKNVIILSALILLQIILALAAIFYRESPLDII